MSPNHANNLALQFAGLMPKMTDEQMKLIRDALIEHATDAGGPACWQRLREFSKKNSDIELPKIINVIRGVYDPVEITKRQCAGYRRLAAEIERYWADVDAFIEPMTDDEFAANANNVLATLPDLIVKMQTRIGLRNSKLIKGAIYDSLQKSSA